MTQNRKTETINIRVSKEQKDSLRKAAQNAGMNISKYLMNLAVNGKIVIVEGGKELAAEIEYFTCWKPPVQRWKPLIHVRKPHVKNRQYA